MCAGRGAVPKSKYNCSEGEIEALISLVLGWRSVRFFFFRSGRWVDLNKKNLVYTPHKALSGQIILWCMNSAVFHYKPRRLWESSGVQSCLPSNQATCTNTILILLESNTNRTTLGSSATYLFISYFIPALLFATRIGGIWMTYPFLDTNYCCIPPTIKKHITGVKHCSRNNTAKNDPLLQTLKIKKC